MPPKKEKQINDQVEAPQPEKKKIERIEVTLKKPHTHAGKDRKPGDKIKVRPKQAEWLKSLEVI